MQSARRMAQSEKSVECLVLRVEMGLLTTGLRTTEFWKGNKKLAVVSSELNADG